MVATLVRLKFTILLNTLKSSVGQLIGSVIGMLYSLALVVWAMSGLYILRVSGVTIEGLTSEQTLAFAVVAGGALLVLIWAVIPLVFGGTDDAFDPARYLHLPIDRSTLLRASLVAGVSSVMGIVTVLALAGTFIVWSITLPALIAGLLAVLLGLVTCVLVTRLVASLLNLAAAGRRTSEVIGTTIMISLMLSGPIIWGLIWLMSNVDNVLTVLTVLMSVLGYTPLGAVWSIPAAVLNEDYAMAAVYLVLTLAYIAVFYVLWSMIVRSTTERSFAKSSSAVVKSIGAFGWMPQSPMGAIAARGFIYWMKDPRYSRSLLTVFIIPVIFLVMGLFMPEIFSTVGVTSNYLLLSAVPMASFLVGISNFTDISYDGSAFGLHVAKGVRGRDDRWGRSLPTLFFGVAIVIVLIVIIAIVEDRVAFIPAGIGVGFSFLLGGIGLGALSSSFLVMPVPSATDSPFKSKPGSGTITMVSMLLLTFGAFIVSAPAIVFGILAYVHNDDGIWNWLSMIVGLVVGVAVMFGGVAWGSAIFDKKAPDMLVKVTANET